MTRPRLSGPRVTLVPVPHAVAAAVAGGGDVAAALAQLDLVAGPGWPHADSADALRPHAEHGDPADDADVWLVVDGEAGGPGGTTAGDGAAAGGVVVGDCGLAGQPDDRGDQEIGYGLAAPARGQGLGTEAVAVLCTWLERQPDVQRVVADVEVGNEASQRLLARLGFVRDQAEGAAVPPYERWAREGPVRRPVLRRLPAGVVVGRHVC